MKIIGIIAEYNPFHNGHLYHIQKIKEKYPNSLLILVMNGYFLERGDISLLSKENKTKIALSFGIDLVLELPVLYGTQSADTFALKAIEILNYFQVETIIFGSERNDVELLNQMAKEQSSSHFDKQVKMFLKSGLNYPTAISKACNMDILIKEPNDLLGISYAKAILSLNSSIFLETIKRTNDYHDLESTENIISASNIRKKFKLKQEISKYVPQKVLSYLENVNEELFFKMIQFKIMTDNDLSIYLSVDEGIEARLKKMILKSNTLEEFILHVKTKRYTYNKIKRMLIHILLGIRKCDNIKKLEYIHIIGFNEQGKNYLNKIKKEISISLSPLFSSKTYEFEKRAAFLYSILTNTSANLFDLYNKPVQFKD